MTCQTLKAKYLESLNLAKTQTIQIAESADSATAFYLYEEFVAGQFFTIYKGYIPRPSILEDPKKFETSVKNTRGFIESARTTLVQSLIAQGTLIDTPFAA